MIDAPKKFALTDDERHSALWAKLMRHWGARIELARTQNDHDIDGAATARLRGRIAELKANLALNNEALNLEAPPR